MWNYGLLLLVAVATVHAGYYGNYHCQSGRDAVVHLFEWKWTDIQRECQYLSDYGYCAVQVSPANEHRIITSGDWGEPYPWYQRYQPVSYKMGSRSGSEQQFRNMVSTCNNLGVRIYVDAVINHMCGGGSGTGSDGSWWNADELSFPAVPYGGNDFHGSDVCHTGDLNIHDYNNPNEVRYCRLLGLRDLRGASGYVQGKIADWMNQLIGWGVAGFRVDAAKHMFPDHIEQTLDRLNNLNTQWFPAGTRPYVFSEVIDMGGEPIRGEHYTHVARVTEFRYGFDLGNVIRKNSGQRLSYLKNFGEGWGHLAGLSALAFVDNHDNQRGHGAGGFGSILTFFESRMYKMATAFMLAYNYGHTRVMSSYYWDRQIEGGKDRNDWVGPPSDGSGNTRDVSCFDEWVCEHRWRQIANMVRFHNAALGQPVSNWWDNGGDAIAFSRGDKAFLFMNNENFNVQGTFTAGVPDGQYCDVITCDNAHPPCGSNSGCRGTFSVSGGQVTVSLSNSAEDPIFAIHV